MKTNRKTTIKIADFFYSAGKKYGFPDNSIGVGIDREVVLDAMRSNQEIEIIVKNRYRRTILPERIINEGKRYNSYYSIKSSKGRDITLIVIPWKENVTPFHGMTAGEVKE